jgi:hypothetical protein
MPLVLSTGGCLGFDTLAAERSLLNPLTAVSIRSRGRSLLNPLGDRYSLAGRADAVSIRSRQSAHYSTRGVDRYSLGTQPAAWPARRSVCSACRSTGLSTMCPRNRNTPLVPTAAARTSSA